MERFGIFELLDALSALPRAEEPFNARKTANEGSSPPPAPFNGSAEDPAPPRGRKTREPAPLDGRNETELAPPEEMGALRSSAPNASDSRAAHDPAPKALESFLKRHDALAKKAEKK